MDRSPLLYVYVGLPVQINQSGLVTLSLGYLCVNFSLPRPLCSRLRPMYATDWQTSDRRQTKASLNARPIRGGGIL